MIKSHFMPASTGRRHRRRAAIASLMVTVAALVAVGARWAAAEQRTIKIAGTVSPFYKPREAEVNPGDTVRWRNDAADGLVHTATSDDGTTFDTGNVAPGQNSNAFTLNKPGEYPYHCKNHPNTMKGTLTVKTAPDPPESPAPTVLPSPSELRGQGDASGGTQPAPSPTVEPTSSPTLRPSPTPTRTVEAGGSEVDGDGPSLGLLASAIGLLGAGGAAGWVVWRRRRQTAQT